MKLMVFRLLLFLVVGLVSCKEESAPEEQKASPSPKKTQAELEKKPAEVVKEKPPSKKKSLLNNLVGEYSLFSISASMGANTMIDYFNNGGAWSAEGSSISQGMREGYDIEISSAEKQDLRSAKISVSKELGVSVFYGGKTYFTTPFMDEKMAYHLKKSPANLSFNVPKELTPTSTFIGEYLYLFAEDSLPESATEALNITGVYADTVILMYHQKKKQFELRLFVGDCCDTAIYTFK